MIFHQENIVKKRIKFLTPFYPIPDCKNSKFYADYESGISKTQFIVDINNRLRNQGVESSLTFKEWQLKVSEKYEKVNQAIQKDIIQAGYINFACR